MAEKDVQLKVAEAIQDDVNKGIVRVDSTFMHQIGVRPGEIVSLKGERVTVAMVDRAYPGDIGLNIIRMDGLIRRNAKTGIGEMVTVKKAEVKEAKKVVISPARKDVVVRASPSIFKQGLLGRAVVKGDIVSLGGQRRRRSAMTGSPFDDINLLSSILDESAFGFGLGDLKFVVADVLPKQAVIITETTEVEFNPEAVELKEDVSAALEVTYEDIGGLGDEIKKIREMVELPLKHPEIFERLGIEPPKGVLLHGPPGTGKTLLAKAVANETNSYFILINGPEIMSKYYGQSLPGDEKILIKEKGLIKRVPIGEVVDSNRNDIEVVCFDRQGKVAIKKVSSLIKHKLNSKLLEVRTASGRSIRVTDYHSLFTLGDSGITGIKTSELKENESFIAVPKLVPFNPCPVYEMDLFEMLKDEDYGIRIRNVTKELREAVGKLGMKRVASMLGVKEKYLYDVISRNVGVRAGKFYHLVKEAGINLDKDFLQLCTKGKSFPSVLRLSEDLMVFLGLWMAEGSYTNKNEVRLSIHRQEEKAVSQLCEKLFGTVTVYRKPNSLGSDIYICSGILGKIMKHVLGFNSGARKKKMPNLIYNLDKKMLSAFLRGYFSGDGSLNTKTPAPMVEVSTENPGLADDTLYLLLQFGIVAKAYGRKNRPQKRICFADFDNLSRFTEIGFLDSGRNEIIYNYLNRKKFSRRDQLPISGEIKKLVESSPELSAWRKSQTIGVNVLQKLANPSLAALLHSDIFWDRVVKIIEVQESMEYVYDISVPECENFIGGFGGIYAHNSEENLRKKFEDAEKSAPSIIFIDEIDSLAPKREESKGEVERRVVAQLLANMDGLKSRGKVVVIAATNIPNSLDPALRRPGRFDREIELGAPDKDGRLNILKIHTRNMPLDKSVNLKKLADITYGFVGADLSALAKEAAMIVLRRIMPDLKLSEEEAIPKDMLEKLKVMHKDFMEALKMVRPSALREVLVEIPNVKWNDLGGLEEVKQQLIEAVEWPLKHPQSFTRLGISPPKGILLYGAPGTGKTLLARAVATESKANFISVKGPELLSKWVGESEKAVREIFKKARQTSPSIIFFDEIDSMAPRRAASSDSKVSERVVNQILTEMDGLESMQNVVVLAATNRPDMLDTALLRPGRFDRIIMTPVPDEKTRLEIFKVHTKHMPLDKDVDIAELAKKTEGYVGADIEAICREAAIMSLREDMKARVVAMKHFKKGLDIIHPSASKEVEEAYKEIQGNFTAARAKEMKEEKPNYFG